MQLPMLGNGFFDVGYVALTGAAIATGALVFAPPRRDVAPLDGLGHREHSPALGTAGDLSVTIGLGVGLTLAFVTELGDGSRGGDLGRAPLIMAEGALAGSAFTQLVKNLFSVCRPRDWNDASRRCLPTDQTESGRTAELREDEARRSFPSGHNAPLAGMAGAAMAIYALPSGGRPEYLPIALTSTGFALTTVLLREQAGAHSWVDTGAAFLTGGAAGFLTAALHMKTQSPAAASAPQPPSPQPMMLGFGGMFLRPRGCARTVWSGRRRLTLLVQPDGARGEARLKNRRRASIFHG